MKSIRTKVVHSQSKYAWNVIGDTFGQKYKIARIPYLVCADDDITTTKAEALEHAEFISWCFNNADKIEKDKTK